VNVQSQERNEAEVASRSALTEEGRTRIRNFQGRLNSYFVLWVVIGLVVVMGGIWLKTSFGYRPLQRLYLKQYIKASIKSSVPHRSPSQYTLLVRVTGDHVTGREQIIGCTDDQVTPVRDETGKVRFDPKLGPFFWLREGIPHKYFYWRAVWQNDSEMYLWLREHIYQRHSLLGLYWICFLPLPVIITTGMILSARLDLRINREYEEGRLLRGIRLLGHREYVREMRQIDGLGLPVFGPERSPR
jgi:hypothetical protein